MRRCSGTSGSSSVVSQCLDLGGDQSVPLDRVTPAFVDRLVRQGLGNADPAQGWELLGGGYEPWEWTVDVGRTQARFAADGTHLKTEQVTRTTLSASPTPGA